MGWKLLSDRSQSKTYQGAQRRVYPALCDCGKEFWVRQDHLHTWREPKSCGCKRYTDFNIQQTQEEIEKEEREKKELAESDILGDLLKQQELDSTTPPEARE